MLLGVISDRLINDQLNNDLLLVISCVVVG